MVHDLLLNLRFNPYAIYTIASLIVYSLLFIIVVKRSRQDRRAVWFSGVLIVSIAAAVAETYARLSVSSTAASFWYNLSLVGLAIMPIFFVGWTLVYTNSQNIFATSLRKGVLLTIPVGLTILILTTNLIIDQRIDSLYRDLGGWMFVYGPYYYLLLAYVVISLTVAMVILIIYRLKTQDHVMRRQTSIFISGLILTFLAFGLSGGLQPAIFDTTVVPIGIFQTFPLILTIVYGTLRYRLFEINPAIVMTNIVNTMNESLFVLNPALIIESTNEAASILTSYSVKELYSMKFKDIVDPADWSPVILTKIEKLQHDKESVELETSLLVKSGERIPVKLSLSPYVEKNILWGIIVVATDLREIKELVQTAAERNKLAVLKESIVDGVVAIDINGVIILENRSFLRMIGAPNSSVVGKNIRDVIKLVQDDVIIPLNKFFPDKRVARDYVIASVFGAQLVLPTNEIRFVNVISSTIKEREEIGFGAIIVFHDLTEENQLEMMKLDFVSMAAHELRTPLTSIQGYLSVFMQGDEWKSLGPEQRMFIDRVSDSAKQLTALMENLLTVSNIEKGGHTLNIQICNWKEIIGELVVDLEQTAQMKGLNLVFTSSDEAIFVKADPMRIAEVINNLVTNAIKYTDKGSVTIETYEDSANKTVYTTVSDTGRGIDKSALPHMFEKFFRVKSKLQQGAKGTGLGLFISKSIVELHGGTITVHSEGEGKGSVFTFTLPSGRDSTTSD